MGSFDWTVPFSVSPNDSALAMRVRFRKDVDPTHWFKEFIIFPVSGLVMNNPNRSENWNKEIDEKGRLKYVFYITNRK